MVRPKNIILGTEEKHLRYLRSVAYGQCKKPAWFEGTVFEYILWSIKKYNKDYDAMLDVLDLHIPYSLEQTLRKGDGVGKNKEKKVEKK